MMSCIEGGVVSLVFTFCCANDQEVRERSAEVLSKMSADKLTGPKARIALGKFLPEIFLDAVKKSPETGVQVSLQVLFLVFHLMFSFAMTDV